MRLFLLNANGITVHECNEASALRIDACGAPAADDTWVASIVTCVPSPRAPERHALITRPGAAVTLGPDRLGAGVAELGHGDHLFFVGAEAILAGDALPKVIDDATADEPCAVCCTRRGSDGRTAILACPRCGARACDVCWLSAPGGYCLTTGCEQLAARDRQLAEPKPSDFCIWLDDDAAGDGEGQ